MGRELQVTVYDEPAGVLMEDDAGRLSYAYSEGARALSVRMPVRSEVYGPSMQNLSSRIRRRRAQHGNGSPRSFIFIDNICRRSEVLFNAQKNNKRSPGKNLAIFSGRFYNRGCHEDFRIRPCRVRSVRLVLPCPERCRRNGQ